MECEQALSRKNPNSGSANLLDAYAVVSLALAVIAIGPIVHIHLIAADYRCRYGFMSDVEIIAFFGFCCFACGFTAIIAGLASLRRIRAHKESVSGSVMAFMGIILGAGVDLFLILVLVGIL